MHIHTRWYQSEILCKRYEKPQVCHEDQNYHVPQLSIHGYDLLGLIVNADYPGGVRSAP